MKICILFNRYLVGLKGFKFYFNFKENIYFLNFCLTKNWKYSFVLQGFTYINTLFIISLNVFFIFTKFNFCHFLKKQILHFFKIYLKVLSIILQ